MSSKINRLIAKFQSRDLASRILQSDKRRYRELIWMMEDWRLVGGFVFLEGNA